MRPKTVSPSQAKDYYYQKDGYFSEKENSNSYGKVAIKMKLKGAVSKTDFVNVISGNDLKGVQVIKDGVDKKGKAYHRAAIDIPFAPPKSASIVALLVGDERVIEAHHQAVAATIKYIEEHYIYARVTENMITKCLKTGNCLVITFTHSTSRENDPQLHTHTLIINITITDKGYRAVFNELIWADQKLLTNVYQGDFAKRIRDIGYEIELTPGEGNWEIAGVKKEWIETFSKRTSKINETERIIRQKFKAMDKAVLRNLAVLESRPPKLNTLTKELLQEQWKAQVDPQIILESILQASRKPQLQNIALDECIQKALNAIHESESTFLKVQLLDSALRIGRGLYDVSDITAGFNKFFDQQNIISLPDKINRKSISFPNYTTPKMQEMEEEIVRNFIAGKETCQAIVPKEKIKAGIEKDYPFFTDDQKNAVLSILSTKDSFLICNGEAGTGKTSALGAVRQILENERSDYQIIGLGYTGKAAMELEQISGIKSSTIHSFQKNTKKLKAKKQLWIVDESSMVGSRQMYELMQRAINENARIVWVGDGRQLQAISAGRMFADLQKSGALVIKMEQVMRQETISMQQLVAHIKDFQAGKNKKGIHDAFELLKEENSLFQIKTEKARLKAVKNNYIGRPDYKNVLVITPSNMDRHLLNDSIRTALKENGVLKEDECQMSISVPRSLLGTRRYFAANFQKGQTLYFENRTHPGGIEAEIVHVDKDNNLLNIVTPNGQNGVVKLRDIHTKISLYDKQVRNFSIGERVVFLKNDNRLNVRNGMTGTLKHIDEKGALHIKLDFSGKTLRFNQSEYNYLDHGYVSTVHKSQGMTAKNVIFVASTENPQLNTTESFYVAVTRAKSSFQLYTNDFQIKSQFMVSQEKTSTISEKLFKQPMQILVNTKEIEK